MKTAKEMHAIANEKNAIVTATQELELRTIENLIEARAKEGFYSLEIEIDPENVLLVIDRLKENGFKFKRKDILFEITKYIASVITKTKYKTTVIW